MRLLIVEDEVKTGDYLQQGFREAGFNPVLARNGLDGYHLALTEHFDLLILDVMLPDLDGLTMVKSLRQHGQLTPILLLSAKDGVDDRVRGLESGADDYLIKPFAFTELLARVRTLLRRGQSAPAVEILQIADLQMDLLKRRVNRGGEKITLTQKEFALLELLLRRQGEVLPRSLIASQIWDMNFDSDTNVIDVAVKRLRAKVDDGFAVKLIHTVRGMGYTLDLPDA
ncbi:MAG TPA: DNA-binding response regulator [Rheinheimera sp.]|nr:DNA-binding response regulator [Rheinheimera sp.]